MSASEGNTAPDEGAELIPFPANSEDTNPGDDRTIEGEVVDRGEGGDLRETIPGPALPTRRPDTPSNAAHRRPLLTALLNGDWAYLRSHAAWRFRIARRMAPYAAVDALAAVASPPRAVRGARRIAIGIGDWHTAHIYNQLAADQESADKRYQVIAHRDAKRAERALYWMSPPGRMLISSALLTVAALGWWARFGTLPDAFKQLGALTLGVGYVLCVLAGRPRHFTKTADAARGVVIDTQAIIDACAAAGFGTVLVRGPVTRDTSGPVGAAAAVVELPPGAVAKKALTKSAELASGLGLDEVQVHMERLKGHAGRFGLWIADEDPFESDPPRSPLIDASKFSIWEPIPVGTDPRGRPQFISLADCSGVLLGGEPGSGKSVGGQSLLGAVALDPFAELWLGDGKGVDSLDWEPIAHRIATGEGTEALLEMLNELRDRVLAEREELLREHREKKLTRELARELKLSMILLWIDELARYTTDPTPVGRTTLGKQLSLAARTVASLGRGFGVRLLCATQKPDDKIIPSYLRDMISIRWAMRCPNWQASDAILGSGRAKLGANAATISMDHRGLSYLFAEGDRPKLIRSNFWSDPDVRDVARRAHKLREAAGTLPVRDWPPALLTDTLACFADRPKLHSVDLRAALERAGYGLRDEAALAEKLRAYGIRPGPQWIDGANRNGYRIEQIHEAINNGPQYR